MSNFIDDFFAGQKDCQQGNPHNPNKSESYDRGYSAEYELAAIKDEMTIDEKRVRQNGS